MKGLLPLSAILLALSSSSCSAARAREDRAIESSSLGRWNAAVDRLGAQLVQALRYDRPTPLRVAVADFGDANGGACTLGGVLAEELTTSLFRTSDRLDVVERRQLQRILGEQQLSTTDLADPSSAARVGRLLGAAGLVTGTLSASGGSYIVNARIVLVESGAVVGVSRVTIERDGAIDALGTCGGATAALARVGPNGCGEWTVAVPAGTFWMGSDAGEGDDDERPRHRVTLRGFCIDRLETTVEQYRSCVSAGACPPPGATVYWQGITDEYLRTQSPYCNGTRSDRDRHPVNCVDWNAAVAYCRWAGGRLPTESEWEYAARGSDGRRYPWGNEEPTPTRLNMSGQEDGWDGTAPVGTFPDGASPFGVLDMAGNVWEWTSDWSGSYTADPSENPTGPQSGTYRADRGGSFWYPPADQRAANRDPTSPTTRASGLGFRCVRGGR